MWRPMWRRSGRCSQRPRPLRSTVKRRSVKPARAEVADGKWAAACDIRARVEKRCLFFRPCLGKHKAARPPMTLRRFSHWLFIGAATLALFAVLSRAGAEALEVKG